MVHQLKPCFCLFQRVRDRLYLQPPTMLEESSSMKAYFGALSFTKPLEKLVLRTVSLSVLDWLSKPKGPHLVEAPSGANPEKALAISMTKRMLYKNEAPLVGVGLVYKPHYISVEPFSTAYMRLNEWHKASSQLASEDRITSSQLLFVNPSEASSVVPMALQHPVLLDVANRAMLEIREETLAPAQLRGFRLHTLWSRQAGGELIRQVGFPRLFGESSTSLLEYTPEDIPADLFQSLKIAITLAPPSENHWNMVSDLVLPTTQHHFQEWREAKEASLHPGEAPEAVEALSADESSPQEAPPAKSEANKGASSPQWVLETTQGLLERIHASQLEALYEMGSMRKLDRTLSRALMVEFARIQLVMGKDLTKSLIALCLELENTSQAFLSDISRVLNLQPTDLAAYEVKAHLQALTIKMHLPLLELQAAREELEVFLQQRLQKIGSQTETRELVERLTGRMTSHANKVWELVSLPVLANEEVAHRVVIGQAATPSLDANVFTGILEGLTGRLGLSPPSATSPLVSAREGISRQWASAVREAVLKTEGRVLHARLVTPDILPPGLQLDRDLGLDFGELDVMAPVLMPALLSGLAANIVGLERPTTSPLSASFEVKDSTKGFGGGPPMSGAPRPSHDGGPNVAVSDSVDDVIKYEPYSRKTSQQYSPITDVNLEDIAVIIIDDSDNLDKTIEELQSPMTELTPSKKRGDEPASSSSPSKKRVPQEPTTATSLEDDLPSGVRLVDILPKRYDTLSSDHPWVHKVRCSLLGLEVGTIPSQEDIDSSERFVPRAACKELEPPEVITEHWLPVLPEEGLLLECPPDQFTTKAGWVLLYTPDSLTKYLPAALLAFSRATPPACRL